ncbi:MAG TPA: hypothetical protein VKQ36_11185 [Ktedonobacterales bacterium]|nr:hypothetical protein [Ktedonobacterales bacterium]
MSWFMDPMPDGDSVRMVAQSYRAAHGAYTPAIQKTQSVHDATTQVWKGPGSDSHTRLVSATQQTANEHAGWLVAIADVLFVLGTLLKIIFVLQMAWIAIQAAALLTGIFTLGASVAADEGIAAGIQASITALREAVTTLLQNLARSLMAAMTRLIIGASAGGLTGLGVGVYTAETKHLSGWGAVGTIFGDTLDGTLAGATVAVNPIALAGGGVGLLQDVSNAAIGGPDGFQNSIYEAIQGTIGQVPLFGSMVADTFAPPSDLQSDFTNITGDIFGMDGASNLLPKRMPWDLRVDANGNPVDGVDTTQFPNGRPTANGGIRNAQAYWNQLLDDHPEYFSPDNIARIQSGRGPIIDDQWLQYHPDQTYYNGQPLIHHHLDQGPTAVPLPQGMHARQPWWGYWHPGSGGPNWVDPTTGNLGNYYKWIFSRAQWHGPFGGIFDSPPPVRPVAPGRVR